jgi:hypothetical protein
VYAWFVATGDVLSSDVTSTIAFLIAIFLLEVSEAGAFVEERPR